MGEELIKKVVDTEVKEVSDRVLEFIGSTEKQDRDGEVIRAEGWDLKNYKKNPVFMWAHDYRQPPLGKALSAKVADGKLTFKIEFADADTYEFADTIYKLYKGGFLRATSVGFIPKEWEDGDGEKAPRRTYKKQELLELSAVPVPSNPEAVLTPAREAEAITVKEYNDCIGEWCNVTKPEETEDWIRIPVRACDVTATIDISKKEGIKALYCGEEKKVKTYMFDKREPYNWTMAKAKKWVEEHDSGKEIEETETKGEISYASAHPKGTPKDAEGEWDAAKEVAAAEVDDLKVMCTWVGEDPDLKTNYKLPHHRAGGKHPVVWRAVAACGAVIMGGRGGVNIPDADMPGVKAHIAKHYAEFDKEPPWEKGISQEEIMDELDYLIRLIDTEGMNEEVEEDFWRLVREGMRLTGGDIPDDIQAKVGAVLSAKNKSSLKEAQSLIQSVLDSAESEHESVSEAKVKPTAEEIAEAVRLAKAK